MNKRTALSAFFALLLLAAAPQAKAQTDISLGPRVGYDVGGDLESLFIGADARIGVATLPIRINPTVDFFFVDEDDFGEGTSFLQITANALYELDLGETTFTPYAGGGLSYLRYSFDVPEGVDVDDSDSSIGLNLLGGAEFTEVSGFVPFAQAEFVLGDHEFDGGAEAGLFKLTGGILFDI